MKNKKHKLIFFTLIIAMSVWLSFQQEPVHNPFDRFNEIMQSLATTSIVVDSLFPDDSDDKDLESSESKNQ